MTATPEPTATATPEPTATATPEPTATATPEPTATATPDAAMERAADSLELLTGQVEVLTVCAGLLLLFVVFLAVLAVRR